jgi:type II secretory pathway pseudopilin PulG
MRHETGQVRGFTKMELAIVCAIIAILAAIAVPNFMEASVRKKWNPVDSRNLATAIEAYFVDNNTYPPMRLLRDLAPDPKPLRDAGGWELTTVEAGRARVGGLTTPVAYIAELPKDPFSPGGKLPFAYYTDGPGWIIVSPGPDDVYELDPPHDYDRHTTQPSQILLRKAYDPTNGTDSHGDVWRIKG